MLAGVDKYPRATHECGNHLHIYVGDLDLVWAPGMFYKYFYNYALRLRLEKLLCLEPSRSFSGFF
jgi:hypothetical protein